MVIYSASRALQPSMSMYPAVPMPARITESSKAHVKRVLVCIRDLAWVLSVVDLCRRPHHGVMFMRNPGKFQAQGQ